MTNKYMTKSNTNSSLGSRPTTAKNYSPLGVKKVTVSNNRLTYENMLQDVVYNSGGHHLSEVQNNRELVVVHVSRNTIGTRGGTASQQKQLTQPIRLQIQENKPQKLLSDQYSRVLKKQVFAPWYRTQMTPQFRQIKSQNMLNWINTLVDDDDDDDDQNCRRNKDFTQRPPTSSFSSTYYNREIQFNKKKIKKNNNTWQEVNDSKQRLIKNFSQTQKKVKRTIKDPQPPQLRASSVFQKHNNKQNSQMKRYQKSDFKRNNQQQEQQQQQQQQYLYFDYNNKTYSTNYKTQQSDRNSTTGGYNNNNNNNNNNNQNEFFSTFKSSTSGFKVPSQDKKYQAKVLASAQKDKTFNSYITKVKFKYSPKKLITNYSKRTNSNNNKNRELTPQVKRQSIITKARLSTYKAMGSQPYPAKSPQWINKIRKIHQNSFKSQQQQQQKQSFGRPNTVNLAGAINLVNDGFNKQQYNKQQQKKDKETSSQQTLLLTRENTKLLTYQKSFRQLRRNSRINSAIPIKKMRSISPINVQSLVQDQKLRNMIQTKTQKEDQVTPSPPPAAALSSTEDQIHKEKIAQILQKRGLTIFHKQGSRNTPNKYQSNSTSNFSSNHHLASRQFDIKNGLNYDTLMDKFQQKRQSFQSQDKILRDAIKKLVRNNTTNLQQLLPINEYQSKNYDFFTKKMYQTSIGNCSFYDTMWIKPRYPFIKQQMSGLIGRKNNQLLMSSCSNKQPDFIPMNILQAKSKIMRASPKRVKNQRVLEKRIQQEEHQLNNRDRQQIYMQQQNQINQIKQNIMLEERQQSQKPSEVQFKHPHIKEALSQNSSKNIRSLSNSPQNHRTRQYFTPKQAYSYTERIVSNGNGRGVDVGDCDDENQNLRNGGGGGVVMRDSSQSINIRSFQFQIPLTKFQTATDSPDKTVLSVGSGKLSSKIEYSINGCANVTLKKEINDDDADDYKSNNKSTRRKYLTSAPIGGRQNKIYNNTKRQIVFSSNRQVNVLFPVMTNTCRLSGFVNCQSKKVPPPLLKEQNQCEDK